MNQWSFSWLKNEHKQHLSYSVTGTPDYCRKSAFDKIVHLQIWGSCISVSDVEYFFLLTTECYQTWQFSKTKRLSLNY